MKILALRLHMLFIPCLIHLANSDILVGKEGIPQNKQWVKQEVSPNSNVWSLLEDNSNLATGLKRKYSDNKDPVNQNLEKKQNLFPRILSPSLFRGFRSSFPFLQARPNFVLNPRSVVSNKRWEKQNGGSSLSGIGEDYRSSTGNARFIPKTDPLVTEGLYNSKRSGKLSINGALLSLADMLTSESERRDHQSLRNKYKQLLAAGKR